MTFGKQQLGQCSLQPSSAARFGPRLKFGNADNGLCGGMTYAALDYFLAGMEIPQDEMAPPHEGVPLFDFLVDRLFDSFGLDTVTLILKLINPAYPDSDENMLSSLGLANGRAAVMAHQEWPIIRGDIDSGKPSPMVIITVKSLNPGELGECHQILAYGYSVHGHHVTIRAYDPNSPSSDEVFLSFNDGDVSNRIMVAHRSAVRSGSPIRGDVGSDIVVRPRTRVGPSPLRIRRCAGDRPSRDLDRRRDRYARRPRRRHRHHHYYRRHGDIEFPDFQ